MGKSRDSANLVADSNVFSDITNDRVGIGSTVPTTKLDVSGNVRVVGLVTSTQGYVVGVTTVINSSGVWVGSNSGLQGTQGATGINAWSRKTTTYTAVTGDRLIADTSGGAFTITLPATPSTGNVVTIADGASWATTNLTVARNGSTIEGAAEDLTVDVGGVTVDLIYDGTTWEVFTNNGPQGVQGIQGIIGPQGVQGIQGVQGGNARGLAIIAWLSPG